MEFGENQGNFETSRDVSFFMKSGSLFNIISILSKKFFFSDSLPFSIKKFVSYPHKFLLLKIFYIWEQLRGPPLISNQHPPSEKT